MNQLRLLNRWMGRGLCIGLVYITGAVVVVSLFSLIVSGFVCTLCAGLADNLEGGEK
jgi:hypothetical protein